MPMHAANHTCKLCGSPYSPSVNKDGTLRSVKYQGFCKPCARIAHSREWRKRTSQPLFQRPKQIRRCKCCEVEFVAETSTSWYCSTACRWRNKRRRQKQDAEWFYETRRARDSRRRARKQATSVERIIAREVFERDGFICHLCGEPTVFDPKSRADTSNPRAAELEHIVPLSQGGTHTWSNVACACRACNRAKFLKAFGQMHLPFGPKRTWPEIGGGIKSSKPSANQLHAPFRQEILASDVNPLSTGD